MAKRTAPKQALSPSALDKIAVKLEKATSLLVEVLTTLANAERR